MISYTTSTMHVISNRSTKQAVSLMYASAINSSIGCTRNCLVVVVGGSWFYSVLL